MLTLGSTGTNNGAMLRHASPICASGAIDANGPACFEASTMPLSTLLALTSVSGSILLSAIEESQYYNMCM
eukprot:8799642-Pyramimonas_sp.AAC.1